jgi:predicted nucleic acid-binding Zn ribbon protein
MQRIGELIPEAARRLGLEDELRLARASATWSALIAELVPAAVGASRVLRVDRGVLVVEADHPIVAQELRIRSIQLVAAFAAAPGGGPIHELRLTVRRA